MKILSTEGLTKLIQLIKSNFIGINDTVTTNTVTLATVATSGSYNDLLNKPTIPTVGDGTLTITQDGTTLGTVTMNQSANSTIDIPPAATRNIGEIVTSTIPLTDAGLHLLDGALISGSGIYSDFVDYIADIYDNAELGRGDLIKLPTFTSNTQDGITISDSRNNTTVLQDIFNGANTWSQIGAWSTYWINIDYDEPTYINYYSIQADGYGSPEYPSAWTLQASNDGSNWTTINTQTGITFASAEYKNFYVNSDVTYKQYRIVFSNGVESGGDGELQRVSFNVNSQSKNGFATEEQWQRTVTDYGVCGKFVYDSVNNTVRLPKITGILEGTTDVTALGFLVEAGLPNITGNLLGVPGASSQAYDWGFGIDSNGAFSVEQTVTKYNRMGGEYSVNSGNIANFDARRSSSIYSNSNTVQPQTIKVLYYIVIATITKTDIQVDIDEIATDLNGKADVDLSNISASASAKSIITTWGIPDYSAGVTKSLDTSYTAESSGLVIVNFFSANYAGLKVTINGNTNISQTAFEGGTYNYYGAAYETQCYFTASYTLNKNDTWRMEKADSRGSLHEVAITFYPLRGVN